MPQDKNYLLRALVPILLVAAAIGTGYAVFKNSGQSMGPPSRQGPAQPGVAPPPVPGANAGASAPSAAAGDPPAPIPGLHARPVTDPAALDPIGSLDPEGQFLAEVRFSTVGAGIESLRLARHFDTIERKPDQHTLVQGEHSKLVLDSSGRAVQRPTLTPLAALGVSINGTLVELSGVAVDPAAGAAVRPLWRQVAPGHFEAFIDGGDGQSVARITREYVLAPGSYDLTLRQLIENLSAGSITAKWYQLGPVDLPADPLSYGGDKRRLRFGYLPAVSINPGLQYVASKDFLWPRESGNVLGAKDAFGRYPPVHPVWPNARSAAEGYELSWVGMTNRYFGVAVHPIVDPGAPGADKSLHLDARSAVDRVVLDPLEADPKHMVLAVRLAAPTMVIEPGASHDLTMGMFAGPLSRPGIRKEDAQAPRLVSTGIDGIVVYNFGGPCGWCTFSWLTGGLLWLMHLLHDWVFHDWALAIIFLVVCVRTLLHPVTKWSQIRVQRFSTQMQGMAPKQKQIQEKYAGDKKKMQEEMARLWKEEGINPAGMLGCLPMFLQTPVWIALYAMLYFAFELRHQPAFFGIFQALTNNRWWFLGDLAEPDRAIYFGRTLFTIPLMGEISSVNILPLILAFVFFAHQKYLTPPASAAMTPEQIQQQKIMKWMTVIMFPVFMYNAPSGLALYFIANSTIAIFESRYIRAHITRHDLMNPNRPGQGSGRFMKYINEVADRQRQAVQNRFGQSRPAKPGEGKGGQGKPGKPGADPPPRRFKDR